MRLQRRGPPYYRRGTGKLPVRYSAVEVQAWLAGKLRCGGEVRQLGDPNSVKEHRQAVRAVV